TVTQKPLEIHIDSADNIHARMVQTHSGNSQIMNFTSVLYELVSFHSTVSQLIRHAFHNWAAIHQLFQSDISGSIRMRFIKIGRLEVPAAYRLHLFRHHDGASCLLPFEIQAAIRKSSG